MADSRPNILFVMTDEERYPPPYEDGALTRFRRERLPGREMIRADALELHRHYISSAACIPSRASLFTGQYPSLHGVINTDGISKHADDPDMFWLDQNTVPTMGSWFQAAGYRTLYRGKWHISHADILVPGTHKAVPTNDEAGVTVDAAVDLYRGTDRLGGYGFEGWIGPEPHGAAQANMGVTKDPIYGDQVCAAFDQLADEASGGPWLLVASLVNPHDIAFSGGAWQMYGLPEPDDIVPSIPEPPSQQDSFTGRPGCHRDFTRRWHEALYVQPTDEAYRRFYIWLHELVDREIERIITHLRSGPFAENTIIVFTSDHGDLLGSHGGMVQKWHNAFDETTRVPMLVSGPGIDPGGTERVTSHADVLPTLLGLAGVDQEPVVDALGRTHSEAHPLVGRDLSDSVIAGRGPEDGEPVYFMTEDMISQGLHQFGLTSGKPFDAVEQPARVESVIAEVETGSGGRTELWKLNHYYDRLRDWEQSHGIRRRDDDRELAREDWELYNLSADPQERTNRANDGAGEVMGDLQQTLESTREARRTLPRFR